MRVNHRGADCVKALRSNVKGGDVFDYEGSLYLVPHCGLTSSAGVVLGVGIELGGHFVENPDLSIIIMTDEVEVAFVTR